MKKKKCYCFEYTFETSNIVLRKKLKYFLHHYYDDLLSKDYYYCFDCCTIWEKVYCDFGNAWGKISFTLLYKNTHPDMPKDFPRQKKKLADWVKSLENKHYAIMFLSSGYYKDNFLA